MARRRRTRTVYRTVRRGYRRRKGLISGSLGNILWGGVAGFASGMIPQFIGKWTNPVVFGAAGYFFKKPALLGAAGYALGQSLSGGGYFAAGSGNFWE